MEKSSCIGLTIAEIQSRYCKDWNFLDWMMGGGERRGGVAHASDGASCCFWQVQVSGGCSTPWLLLSYSKQARGNTP